MSFLDAGPDEKRRGVVMQPMLGEHIPNALTVDVEDYFQVTAFSDRVCRSTWDNFECRVEANTERLLRIFDEAGVRGTFFILGWIAERYPGLVRRIGHHGHELASHGYWHQLVYNLSPEAFADDIEASKEAIANASGVVVNAYRAPSFSITQRSLWALDILTRHGFRIDSSIFPISGHDRYGYPDAPKEIHPIETIGGTLHEFPPTAWSVGKVQVPLGGGYFRLFPLQLSCRAIEGIRRAGRPAMFYTHPWEFDPRQPRFPSVKWKTRFRHYVGLQRTESRLRELLARYKFTTVSQVLAQTARVRPDSVLQQPAVSSAS